MPEAKDAKGDGPPGSSGGQNTHWRSTVDPKSQRVYYYHKVTKETRWEKPDELCEPEERAQRVQQRKETRAFFESMERNIQRKIEQGLREMRFLEEGETNFSIDVHTFDENQDLDSRGRAPSKEQHQEYPQDFRVQRSASTSVASRFVRTFSSMDDDMLDIMKRYNEAKPYQAGGSRDDLDVSFGGISGNSRSGSPIMGVGSYYLGELDRKNSRDQSPSSLRRELMQAGLRPKSPSPETEQEETGARKRRNSTGTLYVDNTMSQQDDEATISCVCKVIRAHMVDAARENIAPLKEYDIFKDRDFRRTSIPSSPLASEGISHSPSFRASPKMVSFSPDSTPVAGFEYGGQSKGSPPNPSSAFSSPRHGGSSTNSSPFDEEQRVPSLEVVVGFFKQIYKKSQLESECIIMSLIYCERLIRETRGRLCIRFDNWKPILFACLVMSSKVWDDMSMWNADFSLISPSYNLKRINELELAMLDALKFTIRVSAGEYAKYYFNLRSMIVKLALRGEHRPEYAPLDIKGAKKLELATERFDVATARNPAVRRSATMATLAFGLADRALRLSADDTPGSILGAHKTIGLEELVHTEHCDADGRSRTLRKKERNSGCLDGELERRERGEDPMMERFHLANHK